MTQQSKANRIMPREDFINAMRGVASSVTVVTTDGPAGRHGATVSAFCSVSADPPSALVCLKADSRIARMVSENRAFCINVLPQARRDLADRFAGLHDGVVKDRFFGVECSLSEHPSPVITGATAFSCDLSEVIRYGTHLILVGDVVQTQKEGVVPLTYLQGAYHNVVPQQSPLDYDSAHHSR